MFVVNLLQTFLAVPANITETGRLWMG